MEDLLPPIVGVLRGSIGDFTAKMALAKGEMDAVGKHGGSTFSKLASVGKGALLGIGAAAIGVGAVSVKMAGDFQRSMTELITGAGESQKNIKMVGDGILSMAGQVGISSQHLAEGMYMIESAGFHGAAGLNVLKIAAQGAKVGGAEMATVADALTSALNAYRLPASSATSVTNQLIATVKVGKMHMQDLAGAIGQIMPVAAAVRVPLAQVAGAMATMTMQGTNADKAAMSMRFMLMALVNPASKAQKEMLLLGLSAKTVGDTLLHKGLAAALTQITDAIGKKFPQGSIEYTAALAKIVGGTRGMTAALELSGTHMAVLKQNIASVGAAAQQTTGDVTGWGLVQKDFNQMLDKGGAALGSMAIRLGTLLIPIIEKAIAVVTKIVIWFTKHKEVAIALGIVIGGALVTAIGAFVVSLFTAGGALASLMGPIGLVILAIAGLVAAGFYLAKHWKGVWRDMKAWAIDAWHILDDVWHGIEFGAGHLVSFVVTQFRWMADIWMNVVGAILHGAAAMFGWVPFIGGKLKTARDEFDKFHASIDTTLSGIANDAMSWGTNIGMNLAKGLDASKGQVTAAAGNMAGAIARNTRVKSPAIEGPLSFGGGPEGWGKRFTELYARGLITPISLVRRNASALAGATLVRGGDGSSASLPVPGHLAGPGGVADAGGTITIVIPVTIDGRKVAEATYHLTREELSKFARRNGGRVGLA